MSQIGDYLISFLIHEKKQILIAALSRKAYDIVSYVLMRLNLYLRSLEIPLSELDKKLKTFNIRLKEAEQQRVQVSDLLNGEKRRTEEFLEEQADALRTKALNKLNQIITANLEKIGDDIDEKKIQEEFDKFIPAFFE